MPISYQAGVNSGVLHYLKAVVAAAVGGDDVPVSGRHMRGH